MAGVDSDDCQNLLISVGADRLVKVWSMHQKSATKDKSVRRAATMDTTIELKLVSHLSIVNSGRKKAMLSFINRHFEKKIQLSYLHNVTRINSWFIDRLLTIAFHCAHGRYWLV